MTAALREPRLIAGFLKRFLQERTWEVTWVYQWCPKLLVFLKGDI